MWPKMDISTALRSFCNFTFDEPVRGQSHGPRLSDGLAGEDDERQMDKRHPMRTVPPDLQLDNRRDYPPDLRVVVA